MVQVVASVGLPIDESLMIKKNRLVPENGLSGNEKRISIVTGTHGDELEGQYVCYELQRRIKENYSRLTGIVDVYPALNPLGIDSITRGIPAFDLDMNRLFPGSENGSMPEYIASKIISDLSGSAAVIDIHASNIFLEEIPQVRINELSKETLIPLAKKLNNVIGTPTLVVEMGVGMRITKKYGDQLVDGIFSLMKELGIWNGEIITPKEPIISEDGEVSFINAGNSGVFVPAVEHWKNVKKGDHIGDILDPLTGEINETIHSETDGIVFTLREYPIVSEGSLIARILS